jgi:hypothetical protein
VLDVTFGRPLADHELLGDLLIRQARGDKCGDLAAPFVISDRSLVAISSSLLDGLNVLALDVADGGGSTRTLCR